MAKSRLESNNAVEWIKQIHHPRGDYSLMERLVCHLHRLFDKFAGEEVVVERAAGDLRQLPIMAVGEDREVNRNKPPACPQALR